MLHRWQPTCENGFYGRQLFTSDAYEGVSPPELEAELKCAHKTLKPHLKTFSAFFSDLHALLCVFCHCRTRMALRGAGWQLLFVLMLQLYLGSGKVSKSNLLFSYTATFPG